MAAFTSGASWSFPEDIPGGWERTTTPLSSADQPVNKTTPTTQDTEHSQAPAREEVPQQEQETSRKRARTTWPPRQCRICLENVQPTFDVDVDSSLPSALRLTPKVTYVSEDGGRLLRPCKCKGTQKYVHEDCLAAWRLSNPLEKRNYYECPTCHYRYRLQRLTWGSYISSTGAQVGLTFAILLVTIFVLGFIADPIINLYLDPYDTIMSAGGPAGSLIYEDEPATWAEHCVKGLASLGLLGFAKFLFTISPFQLIRAGGYGGNRGGNNARDRINQMSWIAILIGVTTFLIAVWKAVRAWARRTLESASERVMDVPGVVDDDDDDD